MCQFPVSARRKQSLLVLDATPRKTSRSVGGSAPCLTINPKPDTRVGLLPWRNWPSWFCQHRWFRHVQSRSTSTVSGTQREFSVGHYSRTKRDGPKVTPRPSSAMRLRFLPILKPCFLSLTYRRDGTRSLFCTTKTRIIGLIAISYGFPKRDLDSPTILILGCPLPLGRTPPCR